HSLRRALRSQRKTLRHRNQHISETNLSASGRTVGAALRGRPRFITLIHETDDLGFPEHDLNRGRPRRAAPTVRPAAPSTYRGAQFMRSEADKVLSLCGRSQEVR